MFEMKPSIRRKIAAGYFAVLAAVVGVSLITLAEMEYVKQKMLFGTAVHQFLDSVLELRRYEKSYLLYAQEADYRENARYLDQALDLLGIRHERFNAIASPDQVQNLRSLLARYREAMGQYAAFAGAYRRNWAIEPSKSLLERIIRTTGDGISTAAFDIERNYRRSVIEASDAGRTIVFISIAVLAVIALGTGWVLSRIVVKPLRRIEQTMDEIAGGQFGGIRIDSRDREIVSLTDAFNRMLRELEVRQRHLIQSEKLSSLGTLLSGVAHELNNPLWNISSSNQILLEKGEDNTAEFRRHHLVQIEEQTERAQSIMQSLLDFSRTEHFRKQPLPLGPLLEETLRLVRGHLPPDVSVHVDVPEGLTVTADRQRIQQVFINLVRNASEAISGEGTIAIRAWRHRAIDKVSDDAAIVNYLKYRGKCTLEADTVDIEVRDTGHGIPHDILPKIFDPFFTTKDVGRGSGLGLFIVHEIIEEHDGCIAVDSRTGEGTSFLIRIPEQGAA